MKLADPCVALVLVSSASALHAAASSEDCQPSWRPTFGPPPGVYGSLLAQAVFDDGTGPALYVGGTFSDAGTVPVNSIARWDGTTWSPLGDGIQGQVYAMEVFDDGSGPALYVGGPFTAAGGTPAACIAKWDGASWSPLGSGMSGYSSSTRIDALEVFDDGSGPALYAAGQFRTAGGVEVANIAKWDGASWSALGSGLTGIGDRPRGGALAAFDDGSGPALYAGGLFQDAGGVAAQNVARWDGTSWSALSSGLGARVRALAVFDDGSGSALYAGGEFDLSVGPFERIARWNGASWSSVGGGLTGSSDAEVRHLEVFDDGSGTALYAGGRFSGAGGVPAEHLARWDGTSWSDVGGGPSMIVETMLAFDEGNGGGPELFVTGFSSGTNPHPRGIAKWNGARWRPVGKGLDEAVRGLLTFDDGTGEALYAGGSFSNAGGETASLIARWDGTSWAPLGQLLGAGVDGYVEAMVALDDGGGPALFVAVRVTTPSTPGRRIERWRDGSWETIGTAPGTSSVSVMAAYDDGSGPALYVGGRFTSVDGVAASNIARWDGFSWSPLGLGIGDVNDSVDALAVFDDGSGPTLHVGGTFSTAGGLPADSIATWDGTSWSSLGSGMLQVLALEAFDDGGGPALYAGGRLQVGGSPAYGIGRWDGVEWTPLVTTDDWVQCLIAHDDGSGPALFAAGNFMNVGGVPASRIARWDGASWGLLGSGVNNLVLTLAAFDDGSGAGPGLFAGGLFDLAPDSLDAHLARWQRAADTTPPVIACPLSLLVPDALTGPPGATVYYSVESSDECDPSPSLVCVPPSGSFFPRGTTLVTCTATDSAGNQATCEFEVTVAPKARRR